MTAIMIAIGGLTWSPPAPGQPESTVDAPPEARGSGVAVYVEDDILFGYDPEPALVTARTSVPAAKFPAFDVHCHWSMREDPFELLRAMDERNVSRIVNLSGGWGKRLDDMLDRFRAIDPDRFLIFCNIDFSRIDQPDFGETMSAYLRDAHAKGAAGLKIFKDLGLRHRDASGSLIAIDDPRLDPIWRTCGELGMPVLIHSADPAAFFQPVDRRNERWAQLRRRPSWSFYGDEFPSRDDVLAQRNRMMKRHPDTIFIGAHLGGYAGDLEAANRVLDEIPNFCVDMSARVAELGRQPYSARNFFIRNQDRILFGTDRYPGREEQPRHRIYFRFLETDDEYFKYHDHPFPPTGEWRIYGIFLPDDVLRKVYFENAERIFGRFESDLLTEEP